MTKGKESQSNVSSFTFPWMGLQYITNWDDWDNIKQAEPTHQNQLNEINGIWLIPSQIVVERLEAKDK